MYHLDVGQVYVYPNVVTKEEALQLKLPPLDYDTILVNIEESQEEVRLSQSMMRQAHNQVGGFATPPSNYS